MKGSKKGEGSDGYDGKADGAIDDGSIMTFVGDVDKQARYDVLNSILLAQLAADYAYNRTSNAEKWYHQYFDVLQDVGWQVPMSHLTHCNVTHFVMNGALQTLIDTHKGLRENKEAVKNTVDVLEKQEGNVAFLTDRTTHGGQGNLQVGVVTNSTDQITLALGMIQFNANTTQRNTNVLKSTFSNVDTQFDYGSVILVLDEEVYRQIRADVLVKLGQNPKSNIRNIHI